MNFVNITKKQKKTVNIYEKKKILCNSFKEIVLLMYMLT